MFGLLRTTTLEFIEMRTEEGGVHSFASARHRRPAISARLCARLNP